MIRELKLENEKLKEELSNIGDLKSGLVDRQRMKEMEDELK